MRNLSLSEKEKNEGAGHSIVADSPKYPYGLSLSLDPETVKKLELGVVQVGQKMMALCMVEVTRVSSESTWGDSKELSVTLQITDMEVRPGKEEKKTEDLLYGKE